MTDHEPSKEALQFAEAHGYREKKAAAMLDAFAQLARDAALEEAAQAAEDDANDHIAKWLRTLKSKPTAGYHR